MSLETLKMTYYAYFQSIKNYGIILGENSSSRNTIFKLQKRIIRNKIGTTTTECFREYFKKFNILPLQSQYIYSRLYFL